MSKRLLSLLLALVLTFSLVACGGNGKTSSESASASESQSVSQSESQSESESKARKVTIYAEAVETEDDVFTAIPEGALAFWESDFATNVKDAAAPYRKSGRLDVDVPVTIAYYLLDDLPEGVTIESSVVGIDCADYDDERYVDLTGADNEATFRYLYTGTTYDFSVAVSLSNGQTSYYDGSFSVAPTARLLYVDGVCNVRDCGGWIVNDGTQMIREGMLYRGSEFTNLQATGNVLTAEGAETLLNILGITSVMDLRPDKALSAIESEFLTSDDVNYLIYAGSETHAVMYNYLFQSAGKAMMKRVFEDLTNEDNYPIYYNCSYGVDRTGTIAYVVGALLGMSKDQLMRDWELSGLVAGMESVNRADPSRTGYRDFVSSFDKLPGDTYAEKAEGFLLDCGVTEAQMETVRDLLLMDYDAE